MTTHIQRGHVRLDLEPLPAGHSYEAAYAVQRAGRDIGCAWTENGRTWTLFLHLHQSLHWIGDSARDVAVEAAEFLATEVKP